MPSRTHCLAALPIRAGSPPPSPFVPKLTTQPALTGDSSQRLVTVGDELAV
jgi:hypothetical protein